MKQMVMSPFEKLKSMKKSIFNKGPANNWIGAVATMKSAQVMFSEERKISHGIDISGKSPVPKTGGAEI